MKRLCDMEKSFTAPKIVAGGRTIREGGQYARRAWKTNFEHTVETSATLSSYLVHCPNLHAFWSYWWVSLIHLREVEGIQPAVRDFENAEHEISVYAQNPEIEPDPDSMKTVAVLLPVDVTEQVHGLTDGEAVDVLQMLVERVIDGSLSPDSDFRRFWKPAIVYSVEQLAMRRHP